MNSLHLSEGSSIFELQELNFYQLYHSCRHTRMDAGGTLCMARSHGVEPMPLGQRRT